MNNKMLAHTPGPWIIGTRYPTRVIAKTVRKVVAATTLPQDEDSPSEEDIANARLIAKAPEMRAFIERFVTATDNARVVMNIDASALLAEIDGQ